MSSYRSCPRCGGLGFETLRTYAHCANCLYSEDYYQDTETAYYQSLASLRKMIPYLVDEIEPDEIESHEEPVCEPSENDCEEENVPIGA
ncbi:MAG: hypothetical protein K2X47_15775 [Bdellovibrionales bacterium]|nr:hypothetical protein [Bdellovibrionales bacterium]